MGRYRDLLERYVASYNAGDLDGVMDLYAEDAVQLMPVGRFTGRSAIRERLARELAAFPDVDFSFSSFVEQDDTFADEWVFEGTHTGPLVLPDGTELPATGKRVQMKGMELVRVRDGRIVVDNLYYDNLSVVAQLGLTLKASTRPRRSRGTSRGPMAPEDGTECDVHETCLDEAGLLEHNPHVMDARAILSEKYAYDHQMTACGAISPQLKELAAKHAGGMTVYSFLQGLDTTAAV